MNADQFEIWIERIYSGRALNGILGSGNIELTDEQRRRFEQAQDFPNKRSAKPLESEAERQPIRVILSSVEVISNERYADTVKSQTDRVVTSIQSLIDDSKPTSATEEIIYPSAEMLER